MKTELDKQFEITLFEKAILITTESNRDEAFQSIHNIRFNLQIGFHDWIETEPNTFNYHECCGVLLLFGITPPSYKELCKLLKIQ